ncbi:MAG: hypothetical protein QN183_10240 [Armatimonadota bacterium]|nr:hypothetical protein [Armatimonadota bacterium]MDR7486374.1 hypothetical protein [Armatimonadota bacterium]MDR7532144.1 hypothetical protein [Armatimonadota bacterium]MDR7536732.1 hypothetical protein [Armatimonadota bacterium]
MPGAAAGTLVLAAAVLLAPVPVLEVTHESTGRVLWRVPLRQGSVVELRYTSSLFRVPVVERFTVEGGRLRLVEVLSPADAVFEYLRMDPPYVRRGPWLAATPQQPVELPAVVTRIGQTGQQRLRVDGAELALFRVGTGEAVRIAVERRARGFALWGRQALPQE